MDRVQYEGYVIDVCKHQLADDDRWTLDITIHHDAGKKDTSQEYGAPTTFETRDEAVQRCIKFGRAIIDGKIAGCIAP